MNTMCGKLIRIICLSLLGLALISGSVGVYSGVPSEVTIVTVGVPCDTIGIVSATRMTTLDNEVLSDGSVELVVNAKEDVVMHLSTPDDSTVVVVMRMAILDMSPVPAAGKPAGISIELVNPSILADGLSHRSKIEVLDTKISSEHFVRSDSLQVAGAE